MTTIRPIAREPKGIKIPPLPDKWRCAWCYKERATTDLARVWFMVDGVPEYVMLCPKCFAREQAQRAKDEAERAKHE